MDISLKNETYGHENEQKWVGAWSTTPVKFSLEDVFGLKNNFKYGLHSLSFRTMLRPTISGEDMRITLSNEFGTGALKVDGITAAKGFNGPAFKIDKKTLKAVTFGGKREVIIPKGETVTSDPIGMACEALQYIAFTVYMKVSANMRTFGMIGSHTNVQVGNHLKSESMIGVPIVLNGSFGEYAIDPLITRVDVIAPGASAAVLIGDSTLTNEIPFLLAEKLRKEGTENVALLLQAVKGNRLLDKGAGKLGMIYGEAMTERFERDALSMPGVGKIFIKVGCNDVIHPRCTSLIGKAKLVSTEELIEGYRSLIERGHEKGIKVYMFTRTAWRGYTRNLLGGGDDIIWTREIDEIRKTLNRWIMSEDCPADGYINLDYMCADPLAEELKKEYTTDGVHFTPAGQKAFVDNLPTEYFKA